jgi:DNA-binding SARP family transcriptional activator
MAERVRFGLCSVLTVETTGRTLTGHALGSRKARTLLALLASERGRLVPLDRVTEALWPTTAPTDPAANVATLVSRARRLLGGGVLTGNGAAYGVVPESCTVDVEEARDLGDEAKARLAAGEPALAAVAARRALHLLGAPPALADEPDVDWVIRVRRRIDELRRETGHVLAAAVASTDPREAAAVAAEAAELDPYDERAVRDLMRAQVLQGSKAAALATYGALVARLREELGVDPSPATSRLHLPQIPTSTARSMPSSSMTARVSPTKSRSPMSAGSVGRSEAPLPRGSIVTTRWCRDR